MPRPIARPLALLLILVAAEARGQAGGIGGPGGGIGGMGGQKSPHEAPGRMASVRVQPRGELSVALSADGSRLALGGLGAIMTYDALDGHALGLIDQLPDLPVDRLAFSPDGRWLASSSVARWAEVDGGFGKTVRAEGGLACVWEVDTGRLLGSAGLDVDPDALGFAPDGTLIVSTAGARYKLDPPPGVGRPAGLVEVGPHVRPFANARGQLTTASALDRQGLRSTRGARPLLRTFEGPGDVDLSAAEEISSWASAFSADGKTLAVVGSGCSIMAWDVNTLKVDRQVLSGHFADGPSCLLVDPAAKSIVVGDSKGIIRIWDDRNPQPARTVVGPRFPVRAIAAVEGDKLRVASGGWYPGIPNNQDAITPVTLWEIGPAARP